MRSNSKIRVFLIFSILTRLFKVFALVILNICFFLRVIQDFVFFPKLIDNPPRSVFPAIALQ